MTEKQFYCETKYMAALSVAKEMFKKGIIDNSDLEKIKKLLIAKFKPIISSIL